MDYGLQRVLMSWSAGLASGVEEAKCRGSC